MSNTYLITLLFSLVMARIYAEDPLAKDCYPPQIPHTPIFKSNIDFLLNKFQTNLPNLHYYQDRVTGPGNDNVYALSLCRGDTTISECKTCVSNAATELKNTCPGAGTGRIWYDKCMLRYEEFSFYGKNEGDDFFLWSVNLVNNATEFMQKTRYLLATLSDICMKASSRFAHGPMSYHGRTIHGMVQCSRDLSSEDCKGCLSMQIGKLGRRCCNGTEGGRVIRPACNLRYEMYHFLRNN
ncbi:Cysteine-rich receptor-like protein kinase 25 [Euphorbia peplus]|nr:Cysteine-rich receptor-like protein kinase 25 [Euphorbia peplus]